jgi:2-polyprenyl-3-methyl-5-hydroxy-6-metoxy-1,4-benzoquinol methylase
MPRSHPETKPWIIEKINSVQVKTILDVGAGVGTYSNLLADAGWSGKRLRWQSHGLFCPENG